MIIRINLFTIVRVASVNCSFLESCWDEGEVSLMDVTYSNKTYQKHHACRDENIHGHRRPEP